MAGLWHLVKLFLPSTNRSPKYLMGYLALYMLHRKWKSNDGFSLFRKEAAKLSAGIYDLDDKESENNDPDIDSSFDSDSEKTADESSESDGENYSESEIDKVDSDSASEEKDLSTSSNSKAESDSEFEKKMLIPLILKLRNIKKIHQILTYEHNFALNCGQFVFDFCVN
jgi:hypothetical protein